MAKWADYLVTAVRYNEERTHIDVVTVHEDKGDSMGPATSQTRSWVVSARTQGLTFITAPQADNGKYVKGAFVEIIKVNGEKFLRTDANAKARDNLGNLPEF